MDIKTFKKTPLMGIVRGVSIKDIEPLLETVISAGLETIEITMNTPSAADIIKRVCELSAGRIEVGAGTVLGMGSLEEAVGAGAGFIVSPVTEEDVLVHCVKNKIPVFPGALTPQEVFNAWDMGASMVKIFPSSLFGPKYFKELKAPLDKVELMAVGGVRPENISEYFSCGANAVAFGSSVFKKELLESGDFAAIGDLVRQYVDGVKRAIG
ncbi:MAG: bifunctional 4-hydroxy-2-oxoglutarate aldolase/2-dehydro-3-deoxy-phosphogluconate aldolase [Candidatus Tantalella remota]|nr:bifunctional 4-hydroxy-2-oxoglutarate aldolase/2-dehydro-3-deoxy-phosphogluconate aldolase [Candidatus Tantalella remota]